MNAEVRRPPADIEPHRLRPPPAALRRFNQRLTSELLRGGTFEAAASYGVAAQQLEQLVTFWCFELGAEAAADELERQRWYVLRRAEHELCFVHERARSDIAVPILLLHGYWGPFAELAGLVGPLTNPTAHGASESEAFHVVCPALPGFGVSDAGGRCGVTETAAACAELMASLGYSRYLVHGVGVGAAVAAQVAASVPDSVVGLHVSALRAYPDEAASEVSSLTSAEKSQLSLLTLQREELDHLAPSSPIDDLALALQQLADWDGGIADFTPLLAGLTLAWAFGDEAARVTLYQESLLRPSPAFPVPVALETYPLDAPCLRRFVEQRFSVASTTEHERGGVLPALESSRSLVLSLRAQTGRARA